MFFGADEEPASADGRIMYRKPVSVPQMKNMQVYQQAQKKEEDEEISRTQLKRAPAKT